MNLIRLSAALLFCACWLTACASSKTAGGSHAPAGYSWYNFKAPQGAFSVEMPAPPKTQEEQIDINGNKVPMYMYIAEQEAGAVAFFASVVTYPDNLELPPAENMLDAGRDGAMQNGRWKISSERGFQFQGHAAREFSSHSDGDKMFMHCRYTIVGRSLYQLMVIHQDDRERPKEVQYYLNSFALVE